MLPNTFYNSSPPEEVPGQMEKLRQRATGPALVCRPRSRPTVTPGMRTIHEHPSICSSCPLTPGGQNTFLHQEKVYFSECVCLCVSRSVASDSATPWTTVPVATAHQAPLSMGFSRQEYWSGLSFPSPEDLPNPGIEPWSPALQADSLQQGVEITLCRRKTRASGRPAHQDGNPVQLQCPQRTTFSSQQSGRSES